MASIRQPALFISHGGGPCFWMEFPPPIGREGFDRLRTYFSRLLNSLPARPTSIVIISAHWEEPKFTVSTSTSPAMFYDYHGFPPHTYLLNYPAPGNPPLARRIRELLLSANIESEENSERGYDHGIFVPMMIIDPDARIPVVMVSLRRDLNPEQHIAAGQALSALRDDNVLLVGSGSSYHNLGAFFDGRSEDSVRFDRWLTETVACTDTWLRLKRLINWKAAPGALSCHPREEHLLPLMVIAGAAGDDLGELAYHDIRASKVLSGYAFGGHPPFSTVRRNITPCDE
jgi:aromatic ring-opening dioxygenase catalytic subunit (LigB family)